MRRYPSVDDLALRAFELRDLLGTIPAQDLRMITAHLCRRCRVGRRTNVVLSRSPEGRVEAEIEVCDRCWAALVEERGPRGARDARQLAAWVEDLSGERDILRGQIQSNARPCNANAAMISMVDEMHRLRPVVFSRPRETDLERWRFALLAYEMRLHGEIGSYARVAHLARDPADFPGCYPWLVEVEHFAAVGWFTPDIVQRSVTSARETIARRAGERRPRLLGRAA